MNLWLYECDFQSEIRTGIGIKNRRQVLQYTFVRGGVSAKEDTVVGLSPCEVERAGPLLVSFMS